jgi:hypothetical protein
MFAFLTVWAAKSTCPVSAVGSNGRGNTLQYIDSIMFSWKKSSVWLYLLKPSQGSVPADLAMAGLNHFVFNGRWACA